MFNEDMEINNRNLTANVLFKYSLLSVDIISLENASWNLSEKKIPLMKVKQ
jgi:hypothetical protein